MVLLVEGKEADCMAFVPLFRDFCFGGIDGTEEDTPTVNDRKETGYFFLFIVGAFGPTVQTGAFVEIPAVTVTVSALAPTSETSAVVDVPNRVVIVGAFPPVVLSGKQPAGMDRPGIASRTPRYNIARATQNYQIARAA